MLSSVYLDRYPILDTTKDWIDSLAPVKLTRQKRMLSARVQKREVDECCFEVL